MPGNKIPLLRLFLPFSLGIISGSFFSLPFVFVFPFLAAGATALLLIHLFQKWDRNPLYGITLYALLLTAGFAAAGAEKNNISVLEKTEKVYAGIITDFPEKRPKSSMLKVKLRASLTDSISLRGNMLIYHRDTAAADLLRPGDVIIFSSLPVEISNRGNPGEFNYRNYMERHRYRYLTYSAKEDLINVYRPARPGLINRASITRERIVRLFSEKGVKGESLALASAISLGEKSYLDEEQKDNFKRAGVMHIMAVSGLHAGILSIFVFGSLFFLKGKLNFVRALITILVLWVFTFITGLAPSMMRASLMFSFLHSGRLLKRNSHPVNSMLASAFVILTLNPLILLDASFLLSYAAVLFIILYYKPTYSLLDFKYMLPDRLWQMTSVSLVAQAGTMPLTIKLFNMFPVLFLFSNLVIIPVSSLVVIAGFLTVILSFSGFLSGITAFVLDKASWLCGYLSEITSSVPFASLDGLSLGTVNCLATMVLTAVVFHSLGEGKSNGRYAIILLLVISLVSLFNTARVKSGNELVVYNVPGRGYTGIRSGSTLHLVCFTDTVPDAVRRHCDAHRLNLKTARFLPEEPVLVKAGDLRIIITGDLTSHLEFYKPDVIIVTGTKAATGKLEGNVSLIVFTSAVPGGRYEKLLNSNTACTFWFIREKGCYRMTL